ncbi:MAG: ABC transporter substrate binding protein [bacterium]
MSLEPGAARRWLRTLTLSAGVVLVPVTWVGADGTVAVLAHGAAGPYAQTIEGLQAELAGRGVTDVRTVDFDPAAPRQSPASAEGAAVWVTIGSEATDAALRLDPRVPVIGCPVLSTAALGGSKLATAVTLEFPIAVQVEWLKRFLPDRKNVGVMYEPGQNQRNVDALAAATKRAGMILVAQPVHAPNEIPGALEALEQQSDVILGIPDSLALSRETAKTLLLFSFQNRIPFVGVSEAWAKAGALYALERDYVDLGRQCGELAHAVLAGKAPSALPPVAPRRVRYVVNLRTMEHMNLKLDRELLAGADRTFE